MEAAPSPAGTWAESLGSTSTTKLPSTVSGGEDSAPAPISEEELQRFEGVFASFDRDGDGTISVLELGRVMRTLGQEMTEAELREMINEYDTDGSGCIELPEFLEMMTQARGGTGLGKVSRMRWSFVRSAMEREHTERSQMQGSSSESDHSSTAMSLHSQSQVSRQATAQRRRSSLRRICRQLSDELKDLEAKAHLAEMQKQREEERERQRRDRRKRAADREYEARIRDRKLRLQRSVRAAKVRDRERRRTLAANRDAALAAVAATLCFLDGARRERDIVWAEQQRLRRIAAGKRRATEQWQEQEGVRRRREQFATLSKGLTTQETVGRHRLEQDEKNMRHQAVEVQRHFDTVRRRAEERDRLALVERKRPRLAIAALLHPGAPRGEPAYRAPLPYRSAKAAAAWGIGCRVYVAPPGRVWVGKRLWGTVTDADEDGVCVRFESLGARWIPMECWEQPGYDPAFYPFYGPAVAAGCAAALVTAAVQGTASAEVAAAAAAALAAEMAAREAAAVERVQSRRSWAASILTLCGPGRIISARKDLERRRQESTIERLVSHSRIARTDWTSSLYAVPQPARRAGPRPHSAPITGRPPSAPPASRPPLHQQLQQQQPPQGQPSGVPVWTSVGLLEKEMRAAAAAAAYAHPSPVTPGAGQSPRPARRTEPPSAWVRRVSDPGSGSSPVAVRVRPASATPGTRPLPGQRPAAAALLRPAAASQAAGSSADQRTPATARTDDSSGLLEVDMDSDLGPTPRWQLWAGEEPTPADSAGAGTSSGRTQGRSVGVRPSVSWGTSDIDTSPSQHSRVV